MNSQDGITTKQAAAILGVNDGAAYSMIYRNRQVRRIKVANVAGKSGLLVLYNREDIEALVVARCADKGKATGGFVVGHPAMLKPWNLEGMGA